MFPIAIIPTLPQGHKTAAQSGFVKKCNNPKCVNGWIDASTGSGDSIDLDIIECLICNEIQES